MTALPQVNPAPNATSRSSEAASKAIGTLVWRHPLADVSAKGNYACLTMFYEPACGRGGVQIVDWRNAPVSRLFYRYEEGDAYEERRVLAARLGFRPMSRGAMRSDMHILDRV